MTTMRDGHKHSAGFTLIELMVVIGILAILATLVVSVGSYVRTRQLEDSTKATLRIVQMAVDTYYETKHGYPAAEPGTITNGDLTKDPNDYQTRSTSLYTQLTATKAREVLVNLPSESMSGGRFLDAFGRPLDYERVGGAGGHPVVISAGSDDEFGTADDIRSDNQ